MIADALTTLSSPNPQVILAFIIVIMAAVIFWQNKKIEKLYDDKSALQEKRLEDKIETNERYTQVMGEFSRTAELLTGKLRK